jgi:hypothetical protein
MDIVQNYGRILLQERTTVELLNQRSISHEYHPRILVDRRIESHLVCYLVVKTPQFLCHSLRQRNGCYLARQHHRDLLLADGVSSLYEELRYL